MALEIILGLVIILLIIAVGLVYYHMNINPLFTTNNLNAARNNNVNVARNNNVNATRNNNIENLANNLGNNIPTSSTGDAWVGTDGSWKWNGRKYGNPPPEWLIRQWRNSLYYPIREANYDTQKALFWCGELNSRYEKTGKICNRNMTGSYPVYPRRRFVYPKRRLVYPKRRLVYF